MNSVTDLYDLVLTGKRAEVDIAVERAINHGVAPMEIVEGTLRPAMREVGERFARAEFFLPDLILAAEAMKRATKYLRPLLADDTILSRQETVVIGTAEGDLHDIGKNLVITLLEGSGHRVIDLGIDVAPERFVEAVSEHDPSVVGFSALLSTTMVNIPKTIRALADAGLRQGRIIAVGGAPVTQRNADEWEADLYAPDAGTAVRKLNDMIVASHTLKEEA